MKITHIPPEEIVVLRYHGHSLDHLKRMVSTKVGSGEVLSLNWAEGIVFHYTIVEPATPDLMTEFLAGKEYWKEVYFAPMDPYVEILKIGGIEIPILDVSDMPGLRDVAAWLKEKGGKRV